MAITIPSFDESEGPSSIPSILGAEPLWTVEDVAGYLRLNPETIRIMARRGELPCIKVGRRVWRFRISEIRDWLEVQHEAVGNLPQTAEEKSLQ